MGPIAERRNTVSSIFVGLLLALAYQEMIVPARTSIREDGLTLGLAFLLLIFFLTTIRFFIGAILHLVSPHIREGTGLHWLIDFTVISLEMTVMIFLGGLTSVKENRAATFDFFTLLTTLYAIDVVWIVAQWLLGLFRRKWRRTFIPWGWAYLNTGLIALILATRAATGDPFQMPAIAILGFLNSVAFVIDVVLVDHYRILRPELRARGARKRSA